MWLRRRSRALHRQPRPERRQTRRIDGLIQEQLHGYPVTLDEQGARASAAVLPLVSEGFQ